MNYAIRSGLAITSGYAIQQCTRLLRTVKSQEREEIGRLKSQLESKIRIISPAIDMIELIAARGNTSLDSAVVLTKSIRFRIQSLGSQLAKLADGDLERSTRGSEANSKLQNVIETLKKLLMEIEDAVPLINLAIATSGVNLSTTLPSTVSPSRLLQASMFLSTADSAYAAEPRVSMQVGPAYTLSVYMLFEGHANRANAKGIRETTWQEVIHKARVKLVRVPIQRLYNVPTPNEESHENMPPATSTQESPMFSSSRIPSDSEAHEFAYQLLLVEDLHDGRVHDFSEASTKPGPYEDMSLAGIREVIPIHEISKIFYADTGKILNIGSNGEPNNPVLLLKRDVGAAPPRNMLGLDSDCDDREASDEEFYPNPPRKNAEIRTEYNPTPEPWRFPSGLDLTWIAFEVWNETVSVPDNESSETEEESTVDVSTPQSTTPDSSPRDKASDQMKKCSVDSFQEPLVSQLPMPALRTSLSLLELLIRLSSLQQFQQCSHLAISDELLNFFLSESSSTGAGLDDERRKLLRNEARRRVGFDPYAESPNRFHEKDSNPKSTYQANLEPDEVELSNTGKHPLTSQRGQPIISPTSSLPLRLNLPSSHLDSSPSVRAQARSTIKTVKTDETVVTLQLAASQEPFARKNPLLRSPSDSTLSDSPDIRES
jgi:hypothetical protein